MAFEPFHAYLLTQSAAQAGEESLRDTVMRDLGGIMAENLGSNRVFIPCLVTSAKVFRSGLFSDIEASHAGLSKR
jgi:hypothetical protein